MNCQRASILATALVLGLTACKGNAHHAQEQREVAVDRQPAMTLASGIAAAQKSEPGMQFLAAEIENEGGKVICSVVLAKGDAAREINIDATSGAIVNSENEKLHAKTLALVQELAQDPKRAATTAAQAIEAALKKVSGSWALEVKLEKVGGAFVYEVTLAGGKAPMVAQVSAADGLVKQVSEMEEEEGEEGEKGEGQEKK
jgi:uncharacterized membrane protein YkoI